MALIRRKQIAASTRRFYETSDHFLNWTTTQGGTFGFTGTGAGTGATSGILAAEAGRPGILRPQTGTTATGWYRHSTPLSINLTSGTWNLYGVVRIPTLSNSTQTYSAMIGFGEAASTAWSTNMIVLAHQGTAPNWQFIARNAGVQTLVDCQAIAANTWSEFNIRVIPGQATLTLDGINYNITTNLPTASQCLLMHVLKSLGTANRFMDIDYLRLRFEL